jgi:3-hydroxyacyl-CoA dehydrogenase
MDRGARTVRPATPARDHVSAGRPGRKTGEGFYEY